MRPCFSRYSQLQGNSSHLNSMPNFLPAASSTRTPSGTPSFPIPSPAITAILWLFIDLSPLECDVSSAFELEHLARFVGCRDLQPEFLENPANLSDLLRIGFREGAAAEPQAVFQADAHVSAHDRRHRGDEHLVAPGAEHRPQVGVAEQAVRGALHVHHVLGMRADAAADAEHRLDEKRRLHELAVEEMRRCIQMPDVVALDLEAGVVAAARL